MEDISGLPKIRGKDLPGAVKVMPMGLDAAIKKRVSGEFKAEQRSSSSLGFSTSGSSDFQSMEASFGRQEMMTAQRTSGSSSTTSFVQQQQKQQQMSSSSSFSSSQMTSSSAFQQQKFSEVNSSSMSSSSSVSRQQMMTSSSTSKQVMGSSMTSSANMVAGGQNNKSISFGGAQDFADVHGQEIKQDNLKSQIQSAIVDLESEINQEFKENVAPPMPQSPPTVQSPTMTAALAQSPVPRTEATLSPTPHKDPFSPGKSDFFSPPPLEPVHRRTPSPHRQQMAMESHFKDQYMTNGFTEVKRNEEFREEVFTSTRSVQSSSEVQQTSSFSTEVNGTSHAEEMSSYGVHESGSSGSLQNSSLLQKIMTPSQEYGTGSLKRRDPRKMFTDSSFYNAKHHPTVADQVEMAHKISSALFKEDNKNSKGQQMYISRLKKSGEWIYRPCGEEVDEELPRHDPVPNLKLVMNPVGKVHEWGDIDPADLPNPSLLAGHALPSMPSPEIANPVVEDLQSNSGKGESFLLKQPRPNLVISESSSVVAKNAPTDSRPGSRPANSVNYCKEGIDLDNGDHNETGLKPYINCIRDDKNIKTSGNNINNDNNRHNSVEHSVLDKMHNMNKLSAKTFASAYRRVFDQRRDKFNAAEPLRAAPAAGSGNDASGKKLTTPSPLNSPKVIRKSQPPASSGGNLSVIIHSAAKGSDKTKACKEAIVPANTTQPAPSVLGLPKMLETNNNKSESPPCLKTDPKADNLDIFQRIVANCYLIEPELAPAQAFDHKMSAPAALDLTPVRGPNNEANTGSGLVRSLVAAVEDFGGPQKTGLDSPQRPRRGLRKKDFLSEAETPTEDSSSSFTKVGQGLVMPSNTQLFNSDNEMNASKNKSQIFGEDASQIPVVPPPPSIIPSATADSGILDDRCLAPPVAVGAIRSPTASPAVRRQRVVLSLSAVEDKRPAALKTELADRPVVAADKVLPSSAGSITATGLPQKPGSSMVARTKALFEQGVKDQQLASANNSEQQLPFGMRMNQIQKSKTISSFFASSDTNRSNGHLDDDLLEAAPKGVESLRRCFEAEVQPSPPQRSSSRKVLADYYTNKSVNSGLQQLGRRHLSTASINSCQSSQFDPVELGQRSAISLLSLGNNDREKSRYSMGYIVFPNPPDPDNEEMASPTSPNDDKTSPLCPRRPLRNFFE